MAPLPGSCGAALAPGRAAAARPAGADGHGHQVTRCDAEWRGRLSDDEYRVLRLGGTEAPQSHPLWQETRTGSYACKGCDLPLCDGRWKRVLDAGWVFSSQSEPIALLMGIDRPESDGTVTESALDRLAMVEVHCRRCGSHQGHVVTIDNIVPHGINGTSLGFIPDSA